MMKTEKLAYLKVLCAILIATNLLGQTRFDALGQQEIKGEQYAPMDLVFETEESIDNPFDLSFGARITTPDGTSLNVPGFYNGGNEYIIRFTGNSTGDWSYRTYASMPELSGIKGKISVTDNTNPHVHGTVLVSSEHSQKFSYEDGTPYFALAFELDWLFALDYDNQSAIPRTEQIIGEVKSNGFNQIVMNIYAYDVGWEVADDVPAAYEFGKPSYSPFGGTNENPDFSTLNMDFFQHLDRVIHHLFEQGIVAHVMIYVWNKQVNWPDMYSTDDNRYFDYVIKRYKGYPNIMWDVSKEALDYGRCDIPYINERIARIRKQDAYNRLITVHDYEYCSREPDRVDFISIQNWRTDLYSLSLEAYLLHSDKPVMNIEHGGYEEGPYQSFVGNYVNPEVCLIRNYQCLFAGVYSSYYWQDAAWNVVIYDPMESQYVPDKPKFEYYKHLQKLFTDYDFSTLFPHKPKLTTNGRVGLDNLASSSYPLTNGEGLYMYFVPSENHQINVVLPEPSGGKLQATWFNPFKGEYQDGGTSDWWNWKPYQSPWDNTASVLILQANE